jgi:hypothetical protein
VPLRAAHAPYLVERAPDDFAAHLCTLLSGSPLRVSTHRAFSASAGGRLLRENRESFLRSAQGSEQNARTERLLRRAMHRSPLLSPQRVLAGLITLGLGSLAFSAAAQTQAPPAQAAAPTQDLESSSPQDGRDPARDVAVPAPAPPATTQPVAVPADSDRLRQLARLYSKLERQRSGNSRWQVPLIGLVLGSLTLVTGGMLYVDSMSNLGDLPCDEDNQPCGYNDRKLGAGIVMMMIGPALMLVSAPMLIVRGTRASRMRATETAIRRLGGQVSLAPSFGPRGAAGFRLHARF